MTEATKQEESEQKEYEERKDEYKGTLGEYIETIRVSHDTSINGCVGYIGNRFSHVKTGSFRIEALGGSISKAVDIVQVAQRESKEKWYSGDFLEIENISISAEKIEEKSFSKISILLSKHSFIIARNVLENIHHLGEFNPREIIFILKDACRIEILKYIEIFSEDHVLKNYFRCLRELLLSSKDEKTLKETIKRERNQFETIDGTKVKGFAQQGIYDLYGVIEVIDAFLSVKDIEDMIMLDNTVENYYRKIAKPEQYTRGCLRTQVLMKNEVFIICKPPI